MENWDYQTDFDFKDNEEDDLKNLRFIQEDEFDQHMDDDVKDDMVELCFAEGHYVFLFET